MKKTEHYPALMLMERTSPEAEVAGVMSHLLKEPPEVYSINLCKYKYNKNLMEPLWTGQQM